MRINPGATANRVLIKQDEAVEKIGQMIIPETAGKKPLQGTVIKTSEQFFCPKNGILIPITKKGDKVLYEKHAGSPTFIDGDEYVILLEPDIFVIL